MWASNNSHPSDIATIAAEAALGEIFRERKIHSASPAASGRIAMAVYHAVFAKTAELNLALYFTQWWATDGGDLDAVPDGTPPEHAN